MRDALPGLPDRYRIARELGRGAQKHVYLAHDEVLDRPVAIAAVRAAPEGTGAAARLDEARAMARLGDLPHVVSIYDAIDAGRQLYIVGQYLAGGDLASHLRAAPAGTLPVRRAIRIAAQIAQALGQAHAHGICHRDVKPHNVFLDARGDALLGDFGLAATIAAGAARPQRVGTLAYTPPEQAWGAPADPRGDLYALGCVLYELLTGRPPFVAASPAELLYLHEQEPPVPPIDRNPAVPRVLSELVLKLLAKRPEDRPGCGADVQAALEGMERTFASLGGGDGAAAGRAGPLFGRHQSMRSEPPFVGRADELGVLAEAIDAAPDHDGAVLLVAGEPGVGKTRLLRELCRRADDAGHLVLLGQGSEDVPLPERPFVDALAPLAARLSELEPADAAVLRRFLQLDEREERGGEEEPADRHRLHRALRRALATFSSARPLLLVIDDLHWCDHASLDLFEQIARDRVGPQPAEGRGRVVLVGAYRPVASASRVSRLVQRLAGDRACTTLGVPGLDENDLHALLEGLGVTRPSNQLIHLVHQATAGNPLFVGELVRHLDARGEIARRNGFAVTRAAALQVPPSAGTAISARIGGLDERTRRLLALGALLGPRFALDDLAGVAEESEDEVLERLEVAVAGGLLVDEGQAYGFAHPVVRQVCLGLPSRSRRERMHLRIAAHLREGWRRRRRRDLLLRIAHHLVRAGAAAEPATVCEFARRAADVALERGAWHEAAELLDAVLEAGARADVLAPAERAEVHRWAGYAYHQLSDEGPCFAHLDEAIAGFEATGNGSGLVAVLSERARARVVFGRVAYSQLDDVTRLEEAMAALDVRQWRLRAVAHGALAVTYWAGGRSARAEALAEAGLAIAREHGDDRLCAELCWDLASAQQQGVRLREALATCRAGLAHARRAGVPASSATCLQRMPLVQFMLGRLPEVEATVREARELNRIAFSTGDESVALAMMAALEATRGRFDEAARWVGEAMRLHERIGYAWGAVLALVTQAHCHAVRGDRQAATAAIDEIVRPGRIFEDPSALAATLAPNRLLIDLYTGRPVDLGAEPAGFLAAPADEQALDSSLVTAYCFQVELAAAAGRPDLAAPLEGVLAFAEDRGITFTIAWPFLVARIRGVAAALAGRTAEATAHFERAAWRARECGARPELGRTLLDHARLLMAQGLHQGERERAAAFVRQAAATFADCGMKGFAAQADTLSARLDPWEPGVAAGPQAR